MERSKLVFTADVSTINMFSTNTLDWYLNTLNEAIENTESLFGITIKKKVNITIEENLGVIAYLGDNIQIDKDWFEYYITMDFNKGQLYTDFENVITAVIWNDDNFVHLNIPYTIRSLIFAYLTEKSNVKVRGNGQSTIYQGEEIIKYYKEVYDTKIMEGIYDSEGDLGFTYTLLRIKNEIGWEAFEEAIKGLVEFSRIDPEPWGASEIDVINILLDTAAEYSGKNIYGMFTETEKIVYESHFGEKIGGEIEETGDIIYIKTATDLQNIENDLSGHYELLNDIDLEGFDWKPIGSEGRPFTGVLNGNNHCIKNLSIYSYDKFYYPQSSFITYIDRALIENLKFHNLSIEEYPGYYERDEIETPEKRIKYYDELSTFQAPFGVSFSSTIRNVNIRDITIGENWNLVGGLVGYADGTKIENCSVESGRIEGMEIAPTGALVGIASNTTIKECYTNIDTGIQFDLSAGMVAIARTGVHIENSYTSGNISIYLQSYVDYDHSFIGSIDYGVDLNSITIKNSYGLTEHGGYLTLAPAGVNIINSYHMSKDIEEGRKTSDELKMQSTFVGWDFENIWQIDEGSSYPYLKGKDYAVSNRRIIGDYSVTDTGKSSKTPISYIKEHLPEDVVSSAKFSLARDGSQETYKFVKGELLISAKLSTAYFEMENLVAMYGGTIVGYLEIPNSYQVYFEAADTEQSLDNLINIFNDSNLVDHICKNFVFKVTDESYIPTTDLEWANEWEDYKRGEVGGTNWGMEAIKAPEAWKYNDKMSEITIGIIDAGFNEGHEDLPNLETIDNDPRYDQKHGTHVTGIIGAGFDNGIGVTGLVAKVKLVGFSENGSKVAGNGEYSLARKEYSIDSLLQRGIKLINCSRGLLNYPLNNPHELRLSYELQEERDKLTEILSKYRDQGYDFLIINSAGNDSLGTEGRWVHTGYKGYFANITDEDLKDRIIMVGNMKLTENGYEVSERSSIGDRVDIFAPGTNIKSTWQSNPDNPYYDGEYADGTSQAAPHVTGVAGMVWSINPSLTGAEVKNIILNNTLEETLTINVKGTNQTYSILNAEAAVEAAIETLTTPITNEKVKAMGIVKLETGMAIPNQKIEVYKASNGALIETIVTDQKGEFNISLNKDIYILHVEKADFLTRDIHLDLNNKVAYQSIVLTSGKDIKIEMNGENLKSDPLPFLYPLPMVENNRTLVSLRPIAESLGFELAWIQENQGITLSRNDMTIKMNIGESKFTTTDRFGIVNELEFLDNVTPLVKNNYTYLPIRSIGEALGMTVEWNDISKTVVLNSN